MGDKGKEGSGQKGSEETPLQSDPNSSIDAKFEGDFPGGAPRLDDSKVSGLAEDFRKAVDALEFPGLEQRID